MTTSGARRNRRVAFAIGLVITILTALAYRFGLFEKPELMVYDSQFKWSPPSGQLGDSDTITHIDIDDASLAEFGRWPWPRARLAEVVDELTELGAGLIVLDIIMPEPQEPRLATSPYSKHHDLIGPSRFIGQDAAPKFVHDDRMLADAMNGSKRVFLSMHFELFGQEEFAQSPGPAGGGEPAERAPRADTLVGPRDGTAVASEWLLTPGGRQFIRDRIGEMLAKDPDLSAAQAAEAIYPPAAYEAGPVQDLIFNAYRRADAMRLLEAYSLPLHSPAGALPWPVAENAVPPVPDLARQAVGAGYVYFEPDPDGTVRGIPLLMRYQDRIYPQLALLMACRLLEVPLREVRVEESWLVLPRAKDPDGLRTDVRIPLDRRHWMLINWRFSSEKWEEGFRHVTIRALLGMARNRQLIEENEHRLQIVATEAVRIALGETSPLWRRYVNAYNLLHDPEKVAQLPPSKRAEYLLAAGEEVADQERQARELLRRRYKELKAQSNLSAEGSELLARIRDIAEPLFEPQKVKAENERLRHAIGSQQAALRPMVAGKVCFVGSTATGAADFVPTPVFSRCPGVVVHSNILNTILTGGFIREVPQWLNLLAIVICGLAASGITAGLGPRLGAAMVFATMAAIVAFNVLVVFEVLREWMVLAGPLAGMFLIWGFVTAYRQLTEERQRRWVTRALGSYTSPAVARRIAEQPDLLALAGEQRVITCFFSDLKGFTPISERLGAERTVALLNRYLDRMTEALLRHEATINKFIGDAIFAFFGAPDVQVDHARRAVAAALDSRRELARLNAEIGEPDTPPLHMRIGIATGPAVVGNCGSARKFDYTAIGDTVNLASRLEAANKFFNTTTMVAGPTADELDSEFLLRPLGRIIVVGKQEAVPVYELLGLTSEVSDTTRWWVDSFTEAVHHFASRRFEEAVKAFQAILSESAEDRAAQIYLDLSLAASKTPPGQKWTDAIELTEK